MTRCEHYCSPGAHRLHWHNESRPRRHKIAAAIAGHDDLLHTVVVGSPLDERRQERARRQCMERLLVELAAVGVGQVWLEGRTPSLNLKDVAMVAAVRSKKLLRPHMMVSFALPSVEPMLWVADAVAGAVGAHRKAVDAQAWRMLAGSLDEIDIRLR